MKTWSCTVPLCPESKANSRRIVRGAQGRRIIRKSDKALAFVNTASLIFRANRPAEPFLENDKLQMSWIVRYPDYRRDFVASAELIADALQQAEIIVNDRQIRLFGLSGAVDQIGEPYVTVTLKAIGTLPWRVRVRGCT